MAKNVLFCAAASRWGSGRSRPPLEVEMAKMVKMAKPGIGRLERVLAERRRLPYLGAATVGGRREAGYNAGRLGKAAQTNE